MALLLNNVMIIMKICLLRIFKLDILLWRHRVWEAEEVRRCCVPARPLARLYTVRQWVARGHLSGAQLGLATRTANTS